MAKPIPEPATPLPAALDPTRNALPASTAVDTSLQSLHLSTSPSSVDGDASSSVSSSPRANSSVFSSTPTERGSTPTAAGIAPVAPHTRRINPRDHLGRINNTPATSVFSDIFAERGVPTKFTLDDLPGPTEVAPVKKVLTVPPARPMGGEMRVIETDTILGVVSAHLSVVAAQAEDSLFSTGTKEEESALIDIHLLTLATAPEERSQGLGAKLLSSLHAECMVRARLMAMKLRSKRSIGTTHPLPSVTGLSPKFIDDSPNPLPSLDTLRGPTGGTGRWLARTFLEVHPSNVHAIQLYRAHGFTAPQDDRKAVKRGFYRGDVRIAAKERSKRGGTDAWVLQRFDGSLDG